MDVTKEKILAYPLPNLRLTFATPNDTTSTFSVLHRDGQGSVRGITGSGGRKVQVRIYPPYGPFAPASETWDDPLSPDGDSHGYIGERFDPEAGLLYLNARYMDRKRCVSPVVSA